MLHLASSEPEQEKAPDLTTNQMIWVFWGGLSLNVRAATTVQLHEQLWKHAQQEVSQVEPSSSRHKGTSTFLSPFFLLFSCSWVMTLPSPAWPKPGTPGPHPQPQGQVVAPSTMCRVTPGLVPLPWLHICKLTTLPLSLC